MKLKICVVIQKGITFKNVVFTGNYLINIFSKTFIDFEIISAR